MSNMAITRFEYDMATGNVQKRWKPDQASAHLQLAYDAKKLFATTETNELGHVQNHTFDYGTGTKLVTTGPNVASCGGTCPVGAPPGSICLATEQYETKIDGLGRPLEQWDTVSDDGCTMYFHKRATTSYLDAVVPTTPNSVTEKVRIDAETSTWTEKRTDLDGLGRPIKETVFVQGTALADQISTYTYASQEGWLTAAEVPDPSANSTARVQYLYTYDTLGRPLTIRRPDSTMPAQKSGIDITYDGVSKTTKEVVGAADGNMAGTTTITDQYGRLVQVQEQTASSTWETTTYAYGPDDLVASIIDPQGVTTSLLHDFAGRRTRITRGTREWKYTYSKNGNLASEQVPGSNGTPAGNLAHTTSIAYDDLDRPLQKLIGQRSLSSADQAAFGTAKEDFYYDLGGNMLGKLRYWYSYAPNSSTAKVIRDLRVTTQGQTFSTTETLNVAGYATMSRSFYQNFYLFGGVRGTYYYDAVGVGSQETYTQHFYDARGLPSSIFLSRGAAYPTQTLAVQTRNVAGLVTKRNSPLDAGNWVESNWSYDALGRVSTQSVQKGPTTSQVARQELHYFGNDNPKQVDHILGTDTKVFNYTYDWRHQLLSAISTSAGYFSGTYTYGNAGRLVTANEAAQSPVPAGSEVKPRNVNYVHAGTDPEQVTALTDVSSGATYASFTYDAAGNMTAKCTGGEVSACNLSGMEKLEYTYDGKDQLRRVVRKLGMGSEEFPLQSLAGSEEYWYGPSGDRVAIVKKNGFGTKTELIWFIGDTQAHYNASGVVTHVYSNISLGTPVVRVDRTASTVTTTEYQFHGLANSTLATVASNGTINTSLRYSPWGDIVESTNTGGASNGTAAHRRRHNDKYVDEVSNLTYYGARYYDKTLIAWTQADPLYVRVPDAARVSSPRRASLYAYTLQNPMRYIDPDGRDSFGTNRFCARCDAGSVCGAGQALEGHRGSDGETWTTALRAAVGLGIARKRSNNFVDKTKSVTRNVDGTYDLPWEETIHVEGVLPQGEQYEIDLGVIADIPLGVWGAIAKELWGTPLACGTIECAKRERDPEAQGDPDNPYPKGLSRSGARTKKGRASGSPKCTEPNCPGRPGVYDDPINKKPICETCAKNKYGWDDWLEIVNPTKKP